MAGWIAALLLVAACPAFAAPDAPAESMPADADDETVARPGPPDPRPLEPGVHHLQVEMMVNGKMARMTYGLYLPETIADDKPLPLLVYLCGAGSRGHTEGKLYGNGPFAEMRRMPALKSQIDFAILAPQCPPNERWERDHMGEYVGDLTRYVIRHWPIDGDRVHLHGMSMGGEGVWHAGLAAPELWATVVCVAGRKHPQPDKVATALKDSVVWMVVGRHDGDFTTGSRAMLEAFKKTGTDVRLTEIPARGHDIWKMMYSKPAFYDWSMIHRLDQPPPEDRPDDAELLQIAYEAPPDPKYDAFIKDIRKQFEDFAPWWEIDNCGRADDAGLTDKALGRENVFITRQIHGTISCRLMTTRTIKQTGRTTLRMIVGAEKRQPWVLEVLVDNRRELRRLIGHPRRQRDDGWWKIDFDLTPYAGENVFIEVYHSGFRRRDHKAYWQQVQIIHEPAEGE